MVYDKNTQKHIDNYIKHFKRKKDELESHQTKAALITLRKDWLESQKRANYNNEYERLIGILSNKVITHAGNKKQLENRIKRLEHLGASAVTGLNGKKNKLMKKLRQKQ